MSDTSVEQDKFLELINNNKNYSKKDKKIIGETLRTEGLSAAIKVAEAIKKFEELPTSPTVFISKSETKPTQDKIEKKVTVPTQQPYTGEKIPAPTKQPYRKGSSKIQKTLKKEGGSIKKQYGYMGGGKVYPQPRTARRPMSGE